MLESDEEDEEDEENEEEEEFAYGSDEEGGQKKKILRDDASGEKRKVTNNAAKSSPFDISSSTKKSSTKVMNFSGLTQDDTEFLYASVKKLGGFDVQNIHAPSMTHLIYNGEKRTIKALYALAKSKEKNKRMRF